MDNPITLQQYREAVSTILAYKEQLGKQYNAIIAEIDDILPPRLDPNTKIRECMNVRSMNILLGGCNDLLSGTDATLKELANIPISRIKKCHNAGSASINHIIKICSLAGITLKP